MHSPSDPAFRSSATRQPQPPQCAAELRSSAAPLPVTISDWKPRQSGTLRGFFTAHLPSGLTLHELSVHTRDGKWWVMPASKPMLSKDGTALRDANGKIRYSPIVSFESRRARDRFNASVLGALKLAHPEIFAEESVVAA